MCELQKQAVENEQYEMRTIKQVDFSHIGQLWDYAHPHSEAEHGEADAVAEAGRG